MADEVHYLTPEGLKEYEERLSFLRNVRRQEVAERLRLALEEGGELVENAEYEDAKNEQAFTEGEILRLEMILSNAQIIDENGPKDTVGLGDRVTTYVDRHGGVIFACDDLDLVDEVLDQFRLDIH